MTTSDGESFFGVDRPREAGKLAGVRYDTAEPIDWSRVPKLQLSRENIPYSPVIVHPDTFARWVALGVITEDGCWL